MSLTGDIDNSTLFFGRNHERRHCEHRCKRQRLDNPIWSFNHKCIAKIHEHREHKCKCNDHRHQRH